MDEALLATAAAPTTRGLIETLTEKFAGADPHALSREALALGELRAALNFALAGALGGIPPPADLAADLIPCVENTDLVIALLGSVEKGLVDALIESSKGALHSARRQGLVLFLAASNLEGREPPDDLRRQIRIISRGELDAHAVMLLGLAALEVGDPDVLEVARDCVAVADDPAGRRIRQDLLRRFRAPLREALPEEVPPDFFGGFTIRRDSPRTGRNDPCPCGSGRKYKRCCQGKEPAKDPASDPSHPWGDRARFHRSMTDAQFKGLFPLELVRIPPDEVSTERLVHAVELLAKHRLFEAAERFLAALGERDDLPEGVTPDSLRVEILAYALADRDLTTAGRTLESFRDPEAVPDYVHIAIAIVERSSKALDRIEALADRALREPDEEALGKLVGVLVYYFPALGTLLARGTLDPADPDGQETTLELIEGARDALLLPPHDPAWEIYDLLSERHLEAQIEASAVEESEQLAEEAEELRRSVAAARARERSAKRALERRERELEEALRAAERRKEEADRARLSAGPSPEEVRRLRRKVAEFKGRIAEGNRERRDLRHRLSRLRSRMDEAVRSEPTEEPGERIDDLEYGEDCAPERPTVRVPIFAREFREGLSAVADHVARAAVATAGALAASEPGAWTSVKRLRLFEDLLSCRIGRHRILFRLVGEDEMEFCRLIHRRDLEATLRRMV